MTNFFATTKFRFATATATVLLLATLPSLAQTPKSRITAAIDNTTRTTLTGSRSPRALPANDAGVLAPSTKLQGITLVFNRTSAQEADLQALIAAQQNAASPLFHQWLTPEQFGARFGMSDSDIASVLIWLQQQGFTLDSVSRSRDRITVSGTAAQVTSAFGAELHTFTTADGTHFAPATDLTLPSALSSVIQNVTNLSDFRPHPHVQASSIPQPKPSFTSSISGAHYLTPLDVATIYDVNAAYNSGFTGTNQSIVIIGQSAVVSSDITTFQTAIGLTPRLPTMVLVPNSGTSVLSSGNEAESDLDLEYSSSIAKGATIYFVYTGNNNSYSAFDALSYAVTNRLAPIISSSYGECEIALGATNYSTLNNILAQAASQGQTVLSAAGDSGSTDCYGTQGLTVANQEALAVDFPASSAYVTGMGGTEFPAAYTAVGNNTYFLPQGATDVISSAISYIPEEAWNDDSSSSGLSSGGGGVSIFTARPTWQTGVSGVPTGFYRLVPDISLDSATSDAPYAFCTSDSTFWNTGQVSSCNSGLRDASSEDLTLAGGTSFAAPIFAGMLAIINQSLNSTGQGVINPTLYTLASNSTTYASAFHDVTSGSNACLAGSAFCNAAGALEYYTTGGYDQATGLGSVDLDKLLIAWPTATAKSTRGSFAVAAAGLTVASAGSGTSTVTVTPTGGYTGTIAWSLTASPVLANACYSLANAVVTGTSAFTETLTVTATSTGCPGAAISSPGFTNFASGTAPLHFPFAPATDGIAAASLLFAAMCTRRSRRFRTALALCVFGVIGFTLAGCSKSSTTAVATGTAAATTVNATKGTYTVTITGTDTVTSTIKASSTFSLTID